MIEYVGWFGSVCFAVCGIPQTIHSIRAGNSEGLTWGFLLLWLFGEFGTIIYVLPKHDIPLLFNYFLNLTFLTIILRYKAFPRKSRSSQSS